MALWDPLLANPIDGCRGIVVAPVEPVILDRRERREADTLGTAGNGASLEVPSTARRCIHQQHLGLGEHRSIKVRSPGESGNAIVKSSDGLPVSADYQND